MWYSFTFLLGLIVGSFVGVIIHRLPKGEQFIGGRSRCPDCGHTLKWYDLVPVFSFSILLGRCRYCRNKISWSYPAIEICSGIIVAASFLFLSPFGLTYWLFWVFILESFLVLAFIDLKHLILPDSVMAVILVALVCYEVFGGRVAGAAGLSAQAGPIFSFGNLAGAALLFLILFLVWAFSNGRGIGLGDAKLAGLIGLAFGFWNSVFILYLAVIIGVVVGLILILWGRGSLKTKLPFGAFICFSAIVSTLFNYGISGKMAEFFRQLIFKVNLF